MRSTSHPAGHVNLSPSHIIMLRGQPLSHHWIELTIEHCETVAVNLFYWSPKDDTISLPMRWEKQWDVPVVAITMHFVFIHVNLLLLKMNFSSVQLPNQIEFQSSGNCTDFCKQGHWSHIWHNINVDLGHIDIEVKWRKLTRQNFIRDIAIVVKVRRTNWRSIEWFIILSHLIAAKPG